MAERRAGAAKPPEYLSGSAWRQPVVAPVPGGVGIASNRARERMVEQLRLQGVRDADVLRAMGAVARHLFVEPALASRAYEDVALPIGHGQTISRPSTVARMLETLLQGVPPDERRKLRALEIGTGCGYQAAVLAALFGEVVSIERVRGLHEAARTHLRPLRLGNLRLVFGDGRLGAPTMAPFERIVLAAAGDAVPEELLRQMAVGGRLLAPVETAGRQALHLIERTEAAHWQASILEAVNFVPLRAGTV